MSFKIGGKYCLSIIREGLNKVGMSDRVHKNCLRFYNSESLTHIEVKLWLCYYLKEKGHFFITECCFKKGGRADIYLLNLNLAIEIVCSEKEKNIIIKKTKYPCDIEVINVNEIHTYSDVVIWCEDNDL